MSFPTVHEWLRAHTREVIASIAPAWRLASFGAWHGEPIAASCRVERDVTSFRGSHGTLNTMDLMCCETKSQC